jgi:UDP-N-acetylmuramoyl-L-alanyl-D-glutamate--2,6-diaminopimelate ligase
MQKLKKLLALLPEIAVKGSKEIEITGISSNSKTVAPGNLFIAKKGVSRDGAQYIAEAIQAGASAVLTDLFDPFLPSHVTQILDSDIRKVEAKLAAAYYDFPSQHLFLAGVTGTNGKTTSSFLIRHILSTEEHPCGLIGTIEWDLGRKIQPALYTTPDVITNHRLLREMLKEGCVAAAMEVSSHALDQGRVEGLKFDAAVFTNLTQDHLDYHKTMEQYGLAKAKLFSMLTTESFAILNRDSPSWELMRKDCKAEVFTYGVNHPCDLRAEEIELKADGTHFNLHHFGRKTKISSPLFGHFNVYNVLAAIGVALCYGLEIEEIQKKLSCFSQVPGRLEKIPNGKDLFVFVDYAHSEDALEKVLRTLREITKKRLLVVFGCGGDRDQGKRPKMGSVATRFADFAVITNDNPRSEDPQAIIEDILKGCSDPSRYFVEPNRRAAIEKAISLLTPGDFLLIAGKGHERYQIVGSIQHPFDDREVVSSLLT